MLKVSSDTIQTYISALHRDYSPATVRRKLSSLRKFVEYLNSTGRLSDTKAANLRTQIQKIGETQKTRIEQTDTNSTEKIVSAASQERYEGVFLKSLENLPKRKSAKIGLSATVITVLFFFAVNVFLLGRLYTGLSQKLETLSPVGAQTADPTKNLATALTVSANLADTYEIPLSYEQELAFSLYPSVDAADPLYTTGRCPTTPDNDGNFKLDLGIDCGSPIPYSLFTDYPEIYLAVGLGTGEELSPRQPLKKLDLSFTPPTPTPTFPLFVENSPTPSPLPLTLKTLSATSSATPSASAK